LAQAVDEFEQGVRVFGQAVVQLVAELVESGMVVVELGRDTGAGGHLVLL
jgi:hypothetical protein